MLIKSVLMPIQVFWSGAFLLPKSVTKDIEAICRKFLWKGPLLQSGGTRIAWKSLCLPYREGGLGFRSLQHWNKALMLKHLWAIFNEEGTLWSRWVRTNLIG